MKTDVKKIDATKREITIELPVGIVNQHIDKCYADISQKANVPGFRQGKVPIDIVKQKFNKEAMVDAADTMVNSYAQQALIESKLDIVSQAVVKEADYKQDGSFYFALEVDVRPKIKLGKYKGIKLKKQSTQVKDEDVEKTIEALREQCASYESVEEARPVQDGDYLDCQLESYLDGKTLENQKNAMLVVQKGKTKDEFYNNLIGAQKGQVKEFKVAVSEKDNVDPKFAGKEIDCKVTINDIKKKQLPKIDDDFAKKVFKADTAAKMKEQIQQRLKSSYEYESTQDINKQIVDSLVDASSCDVPDSLRQSQLKYLVERAKQDLVNYRGAQKEQVEAIDEDLKKKFIPVAESQVKLMFIIDEIARVEKIEVNEDEISKYIQDAAAQMNKTKEELLEHIKKNNLADSILMDLREKKVMKFVEENANIQEVERTEKEIKK